MKKLIITVIFISFILTSCTTPSNANQNISSAPSSSSAEVDRTEEYVEMVREALIEVYNYDIKKVQDKEFPDTINLIYDQNLTDEYASKKEHKFKKDFKRITFDVRAIPLSYIEFFEFTDQKDFDRCVDWLTLRQDDEYFSHAEIFYAEFPYAILTSADELENQNMFLEIMKEKLI